jgi:hypothetical protein
LIFKHEGFVRQHYVHPKCLGFSAFALDERICVQRANAVFVFVGKLNAESIPTDRYSESSLSFRGASELALAR